jgi:hypothetical protein
MIHPEKCIVYGMKFFNTIMCQAYSKDALTPIASLFWSL